MSDISAKYRAAVKTVETMRAASTHFAAFRASGSLGRIETVAGVIAGFAQPFRTDELTEPAEGAMELIRAFERHGEGLRPFSAGEAAAVGDVLVAADRTIWIVDRVAATGKIEALVGGRVGSKAPVVLRWKPSSEARRWLAPGQKAGAAYRDPDAALAQLAGQWDRSESETRYFTRPEALFWQLTETRGLSFSRKGLDDEADEKTVRAWLRTRDATPAGSEPNPMPGDLFWLDRVKGFSLVLRVDGERVDALFINRGGRGPLGEAKGTAQIARAITIPPDAMMWRPA